MISCPLNIKNGIKFLSVLFIVYSTVLSIYELAQYALGSPNAYSDLPRSTTPPLFFDFAIWSHNLSDCPIDLADFSLNNSCSNSFYPFAYPVYPLYLLRLLPIVTTSHLYLGLILGLTTTISIALLFIHSISRSSDGVLSLSLAATYIILTNTLPFRYLLERGQIDQVVILIFLAIYVMYIICDRSKLASVRSAAVFILLIIATFVKIYPVIALIYFFVLNNRNILRNIACTTGYSIRNRLTNKNAQRFLSQSISIAVLAVLLYPSYIDAKNAASFPNVGSHGFGLKVLQYASYNHIPTLTITSKIFIFTLALTWAITTLLAINYSESALFSNAPSLKGKAMIALLASVTMSIVYLTSYSINYKLSLLILIVPFLCEASRSIEKSERQLFSTTLVILSLNMLLVGYPAYDKTLAVYKEWFCQFMLQPFIFGAILGVSLTFVIRSLIFQRHNLAQ